ncbi:hypothetical protein GcC1_c14739o6 [Golovinomyces cichoracearum]|uniref:Secreted protein n=1 Tax=Golovinomyces cichoracearum TaxID=62708 RepID=A0A420J0B5_9PEZI|nr:hypothetical protein GcC1_c14739o6 [Golovinomyces cichoracearum]
MWYIFYILINCCVCNSNLRQESDVFCCGCIIGFCRGDVCSTCCGTTRTLLGSGDIIFSLEYLVRGKKRT